MRKKRLLWKLFPSYLLITLLSLLAITWYAFRAFRQFYLEESSANLEARTRFLEKEVKDHLTAHKRGSLLSLCRELGRKTATRFTVILPSGEVVADSKEDPQKMDNHSDRPEIIGALKGRPSTSARFSNTLGKDLMYLAIPIKEKGEIIGVLRASIPLTSIEKPLRGTFLQIVQGGLFVAFVAALLSLVMVRWISRPIKELKQGAERFARGDWGDRLLVPHSEEIGGLAKAMNQMASQLNEKIRSAIQQRNELEAVLSSMVEGVFAVDTEERLISLNKAAAQFIGADPEKVQGRNLQEVVRNIDLQRFVTSILSRQEPVEGEIVLHNGGDRTLQAHGTVLRNAQGNGIGALIVLHDVTRLRRLENVRRDFVANVSHELKTPVTSIKGFVETLLDGAINDASDRARFLKTIQKQSNRLHAIIEDLLALSRIEQETEKARIVLKRGQIKGILQAALQACESKASEKKIKIDLLCDDDLTAPINPPLLEQAVVNLIDNAVKYSEPENKVQVEAAPTDREVVIRVRDQGCGIGEEHLPRIFERFYRVDKARSQTAGGTGLGLAIVKHIAHAHGGYPTVESTPGKGSTFSIHLPRT